MATGDHEIGADTDPGDVADLLARMRAELAERDAKLAAREAELSERRAEQEKHEARYGALKETNRALELELKLLKRRLFIAKAERVDTAQFQLEFDELSKKLDTLAGVAGGRRRRGRGVRRRQEEAPAQAQRPPAGRGDGPPRRRCRGDRRRDGGAGRGGAGAPDRRGDELQDRAPAGKVRQGRDPSRHVRRQAGRRWAERHLHRRYAARADPSLLANVVADKFHNGLPLYRLEEIFRHEGMPFDRGTLCRWVDRLGWAFKSVTDEMDADARAHAFLIATDATGFAVQPGPREGKARRACAKGHYFVRIADRDHILFDYTKRHRSVDVQVLFKGYSGVAQADACSVYNPLFRPAKLGGRTTTDASERRPGAGRTAGGSSSRPRSAKHALGREGLVRIGKIFEVDEKVCRKGRPPPSTIKKRRAEHMAPLIDDLVACAQEQHEREKNRRGPARSAVGDIVRQEAALRAVLTDGRIQLTNNWSERELRKVARIRDAALFAGSDTHAESAASHLTLIASAKLHRLDPLAYLRRPALLARRSRARGRSALLGSDPRAPRRRGARCRGGMDHAPQRAARPGPRARAVSRGVAFRLAWSRARGNSGLVDPAPGGVVHAAPTQSRPNSMY